MRTPAEEILYQSTAFAYLAYSYNLGCAQSIHSHEVIASNDVPDIVRDEQESTNSTIKQLRRGHVDFSQINPAF